MLANAAVEPTANGSEPDAAVLPRAESAAFRAALAAIAPCLVTIETLGGTQPIGPGGATQPAPAFILADGPTTGLIHSADGLILTSSINFARNPAVITVVLADGRRFVAELLARDELRHLAMLKIEAAGLPVPNWVTQPGERRIGQAVIAVGGGQGRGEPTMSVGILSGRNRMSRLAVQTDALLSPANFGGPLIDRTGRVVGLCVPMGLSPGELSGVGWYDSGIGFAIPHEQVAVSAASLAAGHTLRLGRLGVLLDRRPGAPLILLAVAQPGPADRAGMQPGDVIVEIDGAPVANWAELTRQMRSRAAGLWVRVAVLRGGQRLEVELVLAVPEDLGEIDPSAIKAEPGGSVPSPDSPPEPSPETPSSGQSAQ